MSIVNKDGAKILVNQIEKLINTKVNAVNDLDVTDLVTKEDIKVMDSEIDKKIDKKISEIDVVDTTNLATKDEVKEIKQCVSDGKSLVASAITDKGVSTSKEDSFKTMATNISTIKQLPSIPEGVEGVIVDKDENVKNIINFDFKIDYTDGNFGVTKNGVSSYFKDYTQYATIGNSIYYSGDNAVLVKIDFKPSEPTVGLPYTPIDVYRYKWLTSYKDYIYAITMSTDYTYTVLKIDKDLANVETLFSTKNVIMNLHVFENYLFYFDTTDKKIKKTTFDNTIIKERDLENTLVYTSHIDKFGNIIYYVASRFVKLSKDLQLVWDAPYPTLENYNLIARKIVTDSKGNIAVGLTSSSSQSGVIYFYKPNGEFIKYVRYSGNSNEVSDVICDQYDIFHMITSYSRYYIMGKIDNNGKYIQLGAVQLPSGCDNIIYVDNMFNFILTKTGSHTVYSVNVSSMTKIATYEVIK